MQDKKRKFDKKIKHYQCLHEFSIRLTVKFPVYNVENSDDIKETIWQEVKKMNKSMPAYKYIRDIIVTDQELIKTTTQKIKRHEEMKTVS